MGRLPSLSVPVLLIALAACRPSDFDDLGWARADGAVANRDAGPDAAAEGVDAGADGSEGPDAGGADAGPGVDAGIQEVEVSLRADEDDCLWAVLDGQLRELLHFAPEDGADGFIVEVGTDSEQCRMGLRFALPVPAGARIESAVLTLYRVGPDSNTAPEATMKVQVFDTARPPACSADHVHDVPAAHAEERLWPSWIGGYVVGPSQAQTASPELATLVQHVVDRPDWRADGAVMLLLSPDSMTGGAYAQFRDSYAGEYPPRLVVRYRAP